MVRQRKPKIVIELPQARQHHHEEACLCPLVQPYIRVSRVGDRKFLISPEIQMRSMDEWAVKNNKRLLPPVSDINMSGRTFRKRSVDNIIEEIKIGNCTGIVLWKWSRWARNQKESAVYVDRVEKAGGAVYAATEDYDIKTAIGRFLHTVNGGIDQLQSDQQSETWHVVHSLRRDDNLPHGGRERFGYDYGDVVLDGERRKRYTPNDEAPDLKKTYDDWLNNASYETIARNLNAANWVTMLGGTWTPQGVARMMDTGFAAGLIRERSPEMRKKIEDGDVGANSISSYDIWRTGSHKAIIEMQVWEEYKARRLANTGIPPRSRRPVHALSAMLFCTECRRRLSTKYAGAGRTHQWYCTSARVFHKSVPVSANNRLSLEAIREWVREQFDDNLPVDLFTEKAREIEIERQRKAEDRQTQLSSEIRSRDGKIEKLLEGVATAGAPVADRYNKMINQLIAEIEDLKSELRRYPTKLRPPKDIQALRALDDVWAELPPAVLHEALSKIISRVEVSPRSSSSTRASVSDRVRPVGVWETPSLDEWLADRPA